MSLPREARDGGPETAASHRTSGPTAPPLGEHDSLETVPLLKKLLTSQSQRSASERPGSLWDSRVQENLHRPGSDRLGGIRGPGPSRSPPAARTLPHAPSGREEPPPASPPGQATAYRARRQCSSAGLHARVAGLTGWAGAGRGGRTGRTGRGCGPRSMPGDTSQRCAREAPPPPGSKRRAPPTGPTPPGPRAQPTARCGVLAPQPSLCDGAAFFKRPHDGLASREPSTHWTRTETRDRMRRPSGFLGESHAKWRGSRAGLRSKSWRSQPQTIRALLRVQLHVTESPETAGVGWGWGSQGGRVPSDSLASALYLNPVLKLTSLLGHLKEQGRECGQLAPSGCIGLQVLLLKVGEWMRGTR